MNLKNFIPEWLRGWWGNQNVFIPRNSYLLGSSSAIWLSTEKPRHLFDTIPQLRLVINKGASMFSNMNIIHVDKNGQPIENSPYTKLFQHPNCFNTQNEFLYQYSQQLDLYGNQFIIKNQPSKLSSVPVALWNISATYMHPKLTGKLFDQVDKNGIVSEYEYNLMGKQIRTFQSEEVFWSKVTDVDNPIMGESPLMALKYPLTNITKAYECRNKMLGNSGALGILTNEAKDQGGGSQPLQVAEKERLQKEHFNNYGVRPDQSSVIFTEAALKWQSMIQPVSELMAHEEVDADMITIADCYGYNINIFSTRNSTYENVKNSIIQSYQDTVQPRADQFCQGITQFLNLQNGERFIGSYEHLSIMKENKLKGMAAIQAIVASLNQAVAGNILTAQQATQILANELNLSQSM